jgi:hypothetical protein
MAHAVLGKWGSLPKMDWEMQGEKGQKVDSHFWWSWYGLDWGCSCRKRWLKLDKNDFGRRMQIRSRNIASQHPWSTPSGCSIFTYHLQI